jgi:hypothetical protein
MVASAKGAELIPHPLLGKGAGRKMAKTNHLGAGALVAGVLVAVGLLMLVVEAGPAEATFPGKNGKIAYSGFDGNDFEIYTISPGGGGKSRVTNNDKDDGLPSYSPNGKKIAYAGYDGNDDEIYTINAKGGGGRVQLTHNTTADYDPDYSPNGKKIAYQGQEGPDADFEIYTINSGGGGRFNVTDNGTEDYEASWGSLQEQDKRQGREDREDREGREDPEHPPELRGHEAVEPEEQ